GQHALAAFCGHLLAGGAEAQEQAEPHQKDTGDSDRGKGKGDHHLDAHFPVARGDARGKSANQMQWWSLLSRTDARQRSRNAGQPAWCRISVRPSLPCPEFGGRDAEMTLEYIAEVVGVGISRLLCDAIGFF